MAEDWTLECPANCTIVLPCNLTSNGSCPDKDLLSQTFLDGYRFWIQRVLLPFVVVIGVLGNGMLDWLRLKSALYALGIFTRLMIKLEQTVPCLSQAPNSLWQLCTKLIKFHLNIPQNKQHKIR